MVVAAGHAASSLAPAPLSLRRVAGGWTTVGQVSGNVPAAPEQSQLVAATMPVGDYDAMRLGSQTAEPVTLSIAANQVEPLLLGIADGHVVSGGVYAGNDEVNLGLGELAGKFVPLPEFDLVDQSNRPIHLDVLAGKDVVIGAFHTTCHETCPLYTAMFLQLAKHLPKTAMLLEVTTDPSVDTPAALSSYAQEVGASWTLGTGTVSGVAGFWKTFDVELSSGDAHTSTLVLVDRHGFVRLVYRGVPKVGNEIPPSLVTSLSSTGLHELATGGDGWGAPDVLQALQTIVGGEQATQAGGGEAPYFTLANTDGSKTSLSDFKGRPLVINFWATYCPPCKAEMPLLARSVDGRNAALVLVNEGDSPAAARAFLDGIGVNEPALLDSDLAIGRTYGVITLPTTIFVRANGTIDRRQLGQLDESVLFAELSNLTSQ